jgi:hypothetical protein
VRVRISWRHQQSRVTRRQVDIDQGVHADAQRATWGQFGQRLACVVVARPVRGLDAPAIVPVAAQREPAAGTSSTGCQRDGFVVVAGASIKSCSSSSHDAPASLVGKVAGAGARR